MANETVEEMAELANEIFDEGIEVTLRDGDLVKVFAAVLVANIATVFVLNGLKSYAKNKWPEFDPQTKRAKKTNK